MAEDQDQSQKTEEPTAKKLADAREKGQVASSKEVSNLLLLSVAVLLLGIVLPDTARDLAGEMSEYLRNAADRNLGDAGLGSTLLKALTLMGLALVVPLALTTVAAIIAPGMQNAIVWSTENLTPKLERISPLAGFKRLFSLKSIVEFVKSLLKITFMTGIGLAIVWPDRQRLIATAHLELPAAMAYLSEMSLWMLAAIVACMTIVAGLDYAYQRFEFTQQMRMSRRDVQDEHKQSDGDPLLKQRLRSLRMEKARQRMMAEVPKSTVVITNPTHFAIALRYEGGKTPAPKVVAKGTDELALRIREVARSNDVPIVESPALARALYKSVDIGALIPPEHYQAVAEIIAFVLRLDPARRGPDRRRANRD